MTGNDWYSGIVVTSDGRCYRLGRDGWPVEQPPEVALAEHAEPGAQVIDTGLPDAADNDSGRTRE